MTAGIFDIFQHVYTGAHHRAVNMTYSLYLHRMGLSTRPSVHTEIFKKHVLEHKYTDFTIFLDVMIRDTYLYIEMCKILCLFPGFSLWQEITSQDLQGCM